MMRAAYGGGGGSCQCCSPGGQWQGPGPGQHEGAPGRGGGGATPASSSAGGFLPGYTAEEWDQYNASQEGVNLFRWWADWIPTADGQTWCANKQWEARTLVDGMIGQWGLETLRSGEGVIDIGGDPGFAAAELVRSGVPVTVVDPGFGQAGKANGWTTEALRDPGNWQRVPAGKVPFRLIRRPFNQAFVDDPEHEALLGGASALVSLYPDEATDFTLLFSASRGMRTAVIPCNECAQYFPKHDPTYEGFVTFLLERDRHQVECLGGQRAALTRGWLGGMPFCQVVLQRTPPQDWAAAPPRGPGRHWPPPERGAWR